MAKDRKSKKDKKSGKAGAKAAQGVKAVAQNPLLAEIVAAALVATAAALKDSKRARALAQDAGDELSKLSKAGAERGSALWDMALEIGRRSLKSLDADRPAKGSKAKPAAKPKSADKSGKKKQAAAAAKR